jgi:Zn finger protein HypA/HybF involved in hydrogenase expression
MHELGIIGEVVMIVERTIATNNLTKVKTVVLPSEQGISLRIEFHVFSPH